MVLPFSVTYMKNLTANAFPFLLLNRFGWRINANPASLTLHTMNSFHAFPSINHNTERENTMNKTQHTPGPWFVQSEHPANIPVKWGSDSIVSTPCGDIILLCDTPRRRAANARLIAAAPDLLDELVNQANAWEAMLEHTQRLEDTGWEYTCRNQLAHARAALAKAQGEGGAE
jgi:hypothetical protein